MIPLVAIVQVHPSHGRRIRLWLPLFLVWLLLVVLGLVLSPLILIACLIARLNPFAAIWGLIERFPNLALAAPGAPPETRPIGSPFHGLVRMRVVT